MPLHPEEIAVSARPPESRLALLREAVRGGAADYTAGPIGRALVLLAVPMVLETLFESIFVLADVFWVARLGAGAVTAVGLTEAYLNLVYTAALGLSIGATAMVARRIGEGDGEAAASAAVHAVVLGLLVSGAIGIPGAIFAPTLLELMGASPAVVAEGTGYARIMLGGNATVVLLFLLNAVFRGAGDAAIAMRVLSIANAINLVLDPLLIFGWGPVPALGLEGAAWATTIGRGTAVALQVWTLLRSEARIRVARRHLAVHAALLARLVRLSGTGTFQIFVGTASWIFLIRILAEHGTAVVAGYTIALRVILFALLPAWGLSNAAATMVGQSLGAGKPERAWRAVRLAGTWNALVLGGIGLVFLALAPWIAGLFTPDPAAARWATTCLRIVSLGFPFYGLGMVLTQAFNGAGDAWTPTWINVLCFWAFELPVAWALATSTLGPAGVFLAVAIAYSAVPLAAGAMFRRGAWQTARV